MRKNLAAKQSLEMTAVDTNATADPVRPAEVALSMGCNLDLWSTCSLIVDLEEGKTRGRYRQCGDGGAPVSLDREPAL